MSEDPDGTRIVSATLEDLAALPRWTIAPEPRVEIGAREGAPGHDLFGVQSAFVLSDGRLVIANGGSHELRFYSPDGAHLLSVGGEGQGPGEFVSIRRADPLRGDSILVSDSQAGRLSLFDGDGEFISAVRVAAGGTPGSAPGFMLSTGTLEDGRTVTVAVSFGNMAESGVARDTTTVLLHGRDGAIADTLGRLPGSEALFVLSEDLALVTPRAFARGEIVRAAGSTIVLATSDDYSFDLVDASGAPSARVRIDAPGCPTTQAEFDEWLETVIDRERGGFRETAREVADAAPRHETHPAFQVMLVDRTDHVLVGRRTCDRESMEYSVFSADGLPVARFALDADVTLLDVGTDYAVLRSRDELDREIVRLHELDRNPN